MAPSTGRPSSPAASTAAPSHSPSAGLGIPTAGNRIRKAKAPRVERQSKWSTLSAAQQNTRKPLGLRLRKISDGKPVTLMPKDLIPRGLCDPIDASMGSNHLVEPRGWATEFCRGLVEAWEAAGLVQKRVFAVMRKVVNERYDREGGRMELNREDLAEVAQRINDRRRRRAARQQA